MPGPTGVRESTYGTGVAGVEVTGLGQWEAWQARELPAIEEVRRGVWSIPVPIPDSPLRYTLCYLLEGTDQGLVVVDPGMQGELGWAALSAGLASAGADVTDISGIVVTHVHPDHHSLSARLREASGAWVAMHPAERDTLPSRRVLHPDADQHDLDWLTGCGVPDEVATEITFTIATIAALWTLIEPDRLLDDGSLVDLAGRKLRTVWTPGHTPGHICLYDADHDLLLSGDHVLPRISPNVGLQPHDFEPPLADYLDSLRRVSTYDSAEILPAHEYRFRGVSARVNELLLHHEERCAEILAVLARDGACTIWQLTERLTWSKGWDRVLGFMRRAALAETDAHVSYLIERGLLRRDGLLITVK